MRKPRVIVIDDEMCILDMLKIFLSRRGFEVIVFSTPTMCSVYERTSDECFRTLKCADILITDMTMPNMAGADLVELQQRKGCMITSQNKAVISGNVDERQKERICTIGSVVFSKPFRLAEIDGWLQECETRIDLEEPLERFERRKECRHNRGRSAFFGSDRPAECYFRNYLEQKRFRLLYGSNRCHLSWYQCPDKERV